jgi:hypothetical protein
MAVKYTTKLRKKRKQRGFENHKISLPLKVPFDWHHVTEKYVVACPRDIHRNVGHVCGDGKLEGVLG